MAFLWPCALLLAVVQPSGFYLKDGDRVVFYGDSITDQRLYTTFVETYAVTRFPKEHFTFVHSGWGGDRVTGGGGGPIDQRLQRDVFPYKPNVVTIMLGMNDASYRAFDQPIFDTYSKGYEHIVESLKAKLPGVRITAIQPSPYDDVTQPPKFEGGYNSVLLKYSEFLKDLASRDHIDLANLNDPVVDDLKTAYAKDPEGAKQLIPDRVHPGPAGHLLMAESLLKAWGAPAVVSSVELDMTGHKVVKSANAKVTGFSGAAWTVMEDALPMPIDWNDASTKLAVSSSDFVDALDQEMLKVTGLTPGKWTLSIDGAEVGSFNADELATGINLAQYPTPMMKQAQAVHDLTRKRADAHNTRWRNIQVPMDAVSVPEKTAAMTALDRLDSALAQKQHAAAQPVAHKYQLVSQS